MLAVAFNKLSKKKQKKNSDWQTNNATQDKSYSIDHYGKEIKSTFGMGLCCECRTNIAAVVRDRKTLRTR